MAAPDVCGNVHTGIKLLVLFGVIGFLLLGATFLKSHQPLLVPVLFQKPSCNTTSTCNVTFQGYHSSELEQRWLQNVEAWQADFCTAWTRERAALEELTSNVQSVRQNASAGNFESLSKVLSRFEYKVTCQEETFTRYSWIEPLVAGLRHPLALCGGGSDPYLLDRSYIILETAQDQQKGGYDKKWYFDLGASTYSNGAGGASQKYFVEEYARRGLEFDRMFLWEPNPGPNVFAEGFNTALASKYHYFSTFADPTPQSDFNPFTIMKALAKPADFVMFKLDIDASDVENKFVQQLMNDPDLIVLVDEFYFEHHVNFNPMRGYWGNTLDEAATLKTSYDLFWQLRTSGIRAHGWP